MICWKKSCKRKTNQNPCKHLVKLRLKLVTINQGTNETDNQSDENDRRAIFPALLRVECIRPGKHRTHYQCKPVDRTGLPTGRKSEDPGHGFPKSNGYISIAGNELCSRN